MTSIKIICEGQASNLKVSVDGDKDNYIYINHDGVLSQPDKISWNEERYVWEDSIKSTTHYIISDIPLKSAPYGDDAPKSSASDDENDLVNFNPNTGRGETGIAISGIFAIMVISVVSIVLMTIRRILSNQNKKQ